MVRRLESVWMAGSGALLLLGAARPAEANCAAGDEYAISVEGSSVQVCPMPNGGANDGRLCPDPRGTGMLRQSVDSGEVQRIAEFCSDDPSYPGGPARLCYLDECVPPGTYRYGFATPWEDPFCGGCPPSQYFGEVVVDEPLSAECTPSAGNDGPQPYSGAPPWGDEPDMCDDGGWLGCSVGTRPRELVLGVQALVALLGLGVMARRRGTHRG
jgi:hypothetical protein